MECHPICPRKTKRKSNWNSTLCTILMRWRTTTTTKTIHITHICMLKLMHHTHMHSTYKNQSNRIIFLLLTQILWWFWMNWWFLLPMASFSFFFSCFFFFGSVRRNAINFEWRGNYCIDMPFDPKCNWIFHTMTQSNGIYVDRSCAMASLLYVPVAW